MKKYRVWAVILPFCLTTGLTACVTTENVPGTSANASNAQMENASQQNENMQQSEAAANAQTGNKGEAASAVAEPPQPPPPPADPCAAIVAQLADQARAGMKTVSGACQDQRIEVNPMWAKDYDGAVRVRIYDAAGKLKSMETVKP